MRWLIICYDLAGATVIPNFSAVNRLELFSLDNVGKSPARFDLEKLRGVNAHYLQQLNSAALYDLIAPQC